ncbi:MAG TPA: hypothetical protein VFZ61_28365 [Polyangiales bacterium]
MQASFARPARLAGLVTLWLCTACSNAENLTQVIAAVDADEEVARALTRVDVEIYDPDTLEEDGKYKQVDRRPLVVARDSEAAGTVSFPFSMGVLRRNSDRFLLVVTGFLRDEPVIEQKALVNFVPNRTHGVGIYLASSCLNEVCGGSGASDWLQLTCDPERGSCGDVPTPETQPVAPGGELDAGLIVGSEPASDDAAAEPSDTGSEPLDATHDAGDQQDGAPPAGGEDATMATTPCSSNPCGSLHACAVAADDFSCSCADGYFQQDAKRCVPKFVEVNAHSDAHACARRSDNSVSCWGLGSWGQLGQALPADTVKSPPLAVTGLVDATRVAAGGHHTCALRAGGTVVCWGVWGGSDQAIPMPEMPREVGASNVVQLGAGHFHTCAVTAAGGILCWGDNENGQLGNGTRLASSTPQPVAGVGDAVEVALGYNHSCARTRAGAVVCWGANDSGQLGDGTTTESPVPVAVKDLSGVAQISAGGGHACARTGAGSVLCWGRNSSSELGGYMGEKSSTPWMVPELSDASQIALGIGYSCALKQDASVVCWGSAPNAEPSDGTPVSMRVLIPVMNLGDAVQLTAGDSAACALKRDGHVVCWGSNSNGELGDASAIEQSITPVMVKAW